MIPLHTTFQKQTNCHVPGIIDIMNASKKLSGIPAQNIRNMISQSDGKSAVVLYSAQDSTHDTTNLNMPYSVLKKIYKAAMAGQDFDLTKYSGKKPKRLERFEDLPEIKEQQQTKARHSKPRRMGSAA